MIFLSTVIRHSVRKAKSILYLNAELGESAVTSPVFVHFIMALTKARSFSRENISNFLNTSFYSNIGMKKNIWLTFSWVVETRGACKVNLNYKNCMKSMIGIHCFLNSVWRGLSINKGKNNQKICQVTLILSNICLFLFHFALAVNLRKILTEK